MISDYFLIRCLFLRLWLKFGVSKGNDIMKDMVNKFKDMVGMILLKL